MKRKFFILIISIVILTGLYLFKNHFVSFAAQRSIAGVFPGSKVEIKGAEFHPLALLRLQGLTISSSSGRIYLEDIRIHYSPASIIKREIKKVELSAIIVALDEIPYFKPGKPLFNVKEISASADVKFKKIEAKGFKVNFYRLKGGELKGAINLQKGRFDKLTVNDVSAEINLLGNVLDCPNFKFFAFGTKIEGRAGIFLSSQSVGYNLNVAAIGLDLAQLSQELSFKEKFEVTGLCDMALRASGQNEKLTELAGSFIALPGGGKFIIRDKRALKSVGTNDQVPLDLALESLKNYHYDKGRAKLYLEDGNIALNVLMEGAQGSRDLTFVFHLGK